jgi:hypothetical protein
MVESKYYTSKTVRSTRSTSRRAKVEQSKLVKQTAIFAAAAIVLSLLSFLVIIPGVLRYIGGQNGGGNSAGNDTTLPPQTPILSAPVPATFSASISLTGYTSNKANVVILRNGEEYKTVPADDQGKFVADVELEKGTNTLSSYAKNDQAESSKSQEYTTIMDNEPPKLEVTQPTDNQSIQGKKNQSTTVQGSTDPQTKLYLNDRLMLVHDDGNFSFSYYLSSGTNTLTFKAIDEAGNVTEKKLTVNFSE